MLEPHIAPPACVTEDAFAALMEISKRPPVVFVEGRGSWLTDQEGKKYLDFIQGWAVNCLGHCPTAIVSAIKSQAEQLLNCSPAYYNAPMIRLAELIARYSGLHRTFFTNSGAEAIEGAIKLARKWGQIDDRDRTCLLLAGSIHGGSFAPQRRRPRADRGSLSAGNALKMRTRLLAHAGDQPHRQSALRQGCRAFGVHQVSQTVLTPCG